MKIEVNKIVEEAKKYILDHLALAQLDDEELENQIEGIVSRMLEDQPVSVAERVDITDRIFSSIRGFGLLDVIMKDDDITEVMINGPKEIFIEKSGRLRRLEDRFESERQLEDIIQRIVGLAGKIGRAHV